MVRSTQNDALRELDNIIEQTASHRHSFTVPTHSTMQRGICVMPKDVWQIYCGISYTVTQGTDHGGRTINSTLRHTGDGTAYPLCAIKQERVTADVSLQPLTKPCHPNVTILHQILYHDSTVSFVYEEMDMSLSQVFSIPFQAQLMNRWKSHHLIGAIFKQVSVSCLTRSVAEGSL